MRCAVAIFAKTIGISPVKTRLANSIGTEKAEAFYRLSIDCVEAFVSEAAEAFPETIYPVWTIAEQDGLGHWNAHSFPTIWTGDGELGTRLANVSEHLFETYDAVMMIGSDSPQLLPNVVADAIGQLAGGTAPIVAGPASDGGFYLFASKTLVSRSIWEAVTYSTETTLAELEQHLGKADITLVRLAEAHDVDTIEDLATLHTSLNTNMDRLNGAQQHLLQWLEEHRSYFEVAV